MFQIKRALGKSGKYFFPLILFVFLFFLLLILLFRLKERERVSETKTAQPTSEKRVDLPEPKIFPPLPGGQEEENPPPRIAIILDDLGWNHEIAVSLLQIEAPISFSVLPNLKFSVKIAKEAQAVGRDVLLHLPMEAHSRFKKYAPIAPLEVSMKDSIIEKMVQGYMNAVPYIKGVNNHMGSEFTENEKGMRVVLGILKREGLFFVDSLTTSKSVAYRLAKQAGVKTARRSVFLDNDNSIEEIEKRFEELKRIAIKTGSAIGIGHPRKNTVLVLKSMVLKLTQSGIRIVSVSELVQ